MNPFLQTLVNQKVKQLTTQELIQYANQYDISISKKEAENILSLVKKEQINIYDEAKLNKLLDKIRNIVSADAANKAEKLLTQLQSIL
ncbi:DUF2624 family protein [Bacillus solimangrovi]|uniref:tRNA methyltransferase n=1 Tax=Bacillus solimangrovi TaxID=1305675 RepID=A0A1E5LI15_9BACI|nr:DUF2624 family protein [Bacillus solimangrovi]OEH93723.1 hypothetical protein BFG57_11845 [Bacillus solimangrovi]